MIRSILNKVTHLSLGMLVGYIGKSHPATAICITSAFKGYQKTEQIAIGDSAYFELKEFIVGIVTGFAIRLLLRR